MGNLLKVKVTGTPGGNGTALLPSEVAAATMRARRELEAAERKLEREREEHLKSREALGKAYARNNVLQAEVERLQRQVQTQDEVRAGLVDVIRQSLDQADAIAAAAHLLKVALQPVALAYRGPVTGELPE
jgi:vacuolar-type H+-ATPase subunit H